MTDPIDLDLAEGERLRDAPNPFALSQWLYHHHNQLLAAARRLRELEGALEFLDEHSSLIDSRDDDRVYEPSRALEMARELGWKGTP